MSTLRLGLAGLGIHGRRYAEHLLEGDVPGASLVAVCRRDEAGGRRYAEEHGLRWAGSPAELASHREVDAVILVLPPDLHAQAASDCLDAGKPVLVEKPMAADAPAARALARKAEGSTTPLMVAQTLRFDAVVAAVRREIESLGAIRFVAINQRFEPTTRGWIDQPGRGGAVLNTGVHGLDLLRFLTGAEPVSVIAETAQVVTRRTEDEFACVVRLEPGGILATLDNARTTYGRSGRIEVACEDGQVRGDHIHRTVSRIHARKETLLPSPPPSPTVRETLRSFVQCVREGTPPPVTASDGLAAVEMVDACALSSRLGRRVTLEEIRGSQNKGPDPSSVGDRPFGGSTWRR